MSPQPTTFGLSRDDSNLIITLACSLDEKPGSNWVQAGGGLPTYLCEVARAIKKTGKDTSTAIAMAVSRVKRWAATGKGDTKAKAAKAIAEWEALKAKSGKKSSKVAASNEASEVLVVLTKATTSTPDYSMDSIRTAWDSKRSEARRAARKANPSTWMDEDTYPYDHGYVREVWNRWLIVRSGRDEETYHRVPYSVAASGEITFGSPTEVVQSYVDVVTPEDTDGSLSDSALLTALALSGGDSECRVGVSFVDLSPVPHTQFQAFVGLSSSVKDPDASSYVNKVSQWGSQVVDG